MTIRRGILLIFLFASALLAASFYLQWVVGLEPCPLCIVQRLCLFLISLITLACLLHHPGKWGNTFYGLGVLCFSALGLIAALRQLWMQSLPATSVAKLNCAPSLNFMIANMPLKETLQHVIFSSGECAEVTWTWLGGSIAAWTSVSFCMLCVFSLLWIIWQIKAKKNSRAVKGARDTSFD